MKSIIVKKPTYVKGWGGGEGGTDPHNNQLTQLYAGFYVEIAN